MSDVFVLIYIPENYERKTTIVSSEI